MRMVRAVAWGYDGTLAAHGRVAPALAPALRELRAAGLRQVLVTGRTFFELLRACGDLELFDAVVAENGGVLYFPAGHVIRDEAPPPPPRLLAELDRRGIPYRAGRVLVETARADEARVRRVLEAVEVHLRRIYNRSRLLLLPHGVSKGTGVRQVLRALGVAAHDVLAVGDGENDLEMFEACGWAACPGTAVASIKARADWIFPAVGGTGVPPAFTVDGLEDALDVARSPRHQLLIGWVRETAEPVLVPERGVNVVVQGDSLSGKSWLAGALAERLLARGYGVAVIDPEGDYGGLAALAAVHWAEVTDEREWAVALRRFDDDPSAGVVLDLSRVPPAPKGALIEAGLRLLRRRRREHGLPHWILLDEAHYWLHAGGVDDEAVGLDDKGFCLVTYRASCLRASALAALDIVALARTTHPEEADHLRGRMFPGSPVDVASTLAHLPQGSFVLVDTRVVKQPSAMTFFAAPRMTAHTRHLAKYLEGQPVGERAFVFRDPAGRVVATAANLTAFVDAIAAVAEPVLAFHAARGDFSRWILDVFVDRSLGGQLAKIERRWSRGEVPDLRRALAPLVSQVCLVAGPPFPAGG